MLPVPGCRVKYFERTYCRHFVDQHHFGFMYYVHNKIKRQPWDRGFRRNQYLQPACSHALIARGTGFICPHQGYIVNTEGNRIGQLWNSGSAKICGSSRMYGGYRHRDRWRVFRGSVSRKNRTRSISAFGAVDTPGTNTIIRRVGCGLQNLLQCRTRRLPHNTRCSTWNPVC